MGSIEPRKQRRRKIRPDLCAVCRISFYFDDQDEVLRHIRKPVAAFKVRNGGNFDFDEKKWLHSEGTGRKRWKDCSQ